MGQRVWAVLIIFEIFVIGFSVVSFDHVNATHPEGFDFLLEGIEALDNSEFEEAIEFFDKVLRKHPNDILALSLTGLAFSSLEDHEEALKYYDEVVEKESNNFFILSLQGLSLIDLEKYGEALIPIDKALELDTPYNYQYLPNELQRALQQLRDEIKFELFLNKGMALIQLEKYDESLIYFDKVLDRDPKKVDALYDKSLALFHLEKYDESLEYLDKLMKQVGYDPDTFIFKSKVLNSLGKPEAALKLTDLVLKNESRNIEALITKGDSLSLLGNKGAMEFYDRAILLQPDNVDGLYGKGVLLESLGRYDEALVYYDKILEIDFDNVKALNSKTKLLEIISGLTEPVEKPSIPDWIRNNAKWWSEGAIGDSDFVSGIQFLIKEEIMKIPETTQPIGEISDEIPSWIKNNADWWAQGLISDDDFIKGIQYLVEQGIIIV